MGAVLVLPGLNACVNTVTGERAALGAAFTPADTDITAAGMRHPYVLKLCPCDETGEELRVFELTTRRGRRAATRPIPRSTASPPASATPSAQRRIRRYDPASRETWRTMPHFLRVEAAGIDAVGFRAGDFVDVAGLPVAWTAGVWVDDVAHDAVDPMMTHNRDGSFDDDPNGLREIAAVGAGYVVLRDVFYTRRVTADYTAAQGVTVRRAVPEMDFVVEAQNRLWGCRYGESDGRLVNELYASALGDPTAWHRFSGLSTASWAASVGSEGPFTGAAVLHGQPVFFKENCVHRIYPSALGAHRVTEQRIAGVAPGCGGSLVPFEGGLSYVSRAGVVRWAGGTPPVL